MKAYQKIHRYAALPEYWVWNAMKQRCSNPNLKAYKNYGGRGIKVCKRWHEFARFLADMKPRPSKSHTLERRNNSKGYSPANCYWATWEQNNRNRRDNRITDTEVIQLRSRYANGESDRQLARAYKLSRGYVWKLIANQSRVMTGESK